MTTLYKRNKNNKKIQQWSIEVHPEGKYRTIEGYRDGKITTNDWTTCTPKNVGKKSETTAYQQTIKEVNAKIVKKKENAYTEDINEVDNVEMFFEPMLAGKYNSFTEPVVSQPKLDGIRNVSNQKGNFTRKGKPQLAIPHIYESLNSLFDEYPDLIVDGELYNHDLRDDFNQITSIARKQKPTLEDLEKSRNKIQFHVYDVCFLDMPDATLEYRISFIEDIISKYDYIEVVDTQIVESKEQLDVLYRQYMEQGFEGQMIRKIGSCYENKRSKNLLKRKEFIDEEFEIVDINEGQGNWTGKAKTILFKKEDGETFSTGVKGDMDYCKDLLENKSAYIGKQGTVRFQELTPDGIPRFGVFYGVRDYE